MEFPVHKFSDVNKAQHTIQINVPYVNCNHLYSLERTEKREKARQQKPNEFKPAVLEPK